MTASVSGISASACCRVAVLIDPSDSWGQRVIQGISAAVRFKLPWDLLIDPRDDQWRYRVPRNWRGDGIIAAIRDSKTAKHVKELGLPAVDVACGDELREERFHVITDDRRRAEMALEHFRNLGFQHFAYYGPSSLRYPARRGEAFFDVVVKAGFRCHLFPLSGAKPSWHLIQQQTVDWLESLPRPLAVLAADPYPGVQVAKLCHALGLRIPEEVAILAGDTDHLMCEVSHPPLSSIVLACEQIGAESVRMLDLLLRGETPPEKSVLVSPLSVIHRESTDIVAADSLFANALRYIRAQAHRRIRVSDVLRAVSISRRLLEQLFQEHLQRTPADEIRRVKLEHAKQLLLSTDQTIEQIADSSGFSSASHLCFAFKRETKQTPMEFRHANSAEEPEKDRQKRLVR